MPILSDDQNALFKQGIATMGRYAHASRADASSAAKADSPSPTSKAEAPARSGDGPATVVDLSDHAKALLERDKVERVVADRLAQQVAAARSNGKPGPESKSASDTTNSNDPADIIDNPNWQLNEQNAHVRADGSVESWSKSFQDVFNVPSTPEDVDQWYQSFGKMALATAEADPQPFNAGLADAIRNRTLKIQDVRDIPDLNFHSWSSYYGGEGGSGGAGGSTFNPDAAFFKDPNILWMIQNDGTVISWQKPGTQPSEPKA